MKAKFYFVPQVYRIWLSPCIALEFSIATSASDTVGGKRLFFDINIFSDVQDILTDILYGYDLTQERRLAIERNEIPSAVRWSCLDAIARNVPDIDTGVLYVMMELKYVKDEEYIDNVVRKSVEQVIRPGYHCDGIEISMERNNG